MALVKRVSVLVTADGVEDARLKISRLKAAAEELNAEHPTIKPQIDSAEALLEARLLREGIKRELAGALDTGGGPGGLLGLLFKGGSFLGGTGGSGLSGTLSGIPVAGGALGSTGIYGLLAAIPIAGAALVALDAIASGIAGAVAGIGAFVAVARPTVTALQTGLTGVSTATGNYQTASGNLNTAINQSPADMKLYQATIHGLEPDLQSAAKLLTDQTVTWQGLSASQQASVLALRDNKDAYKALLPDQKTALDALIKEGNAWNSLTPQQQTFAQGLNKLGGTWQTITQALQPTVMKVLNDGLKIANTLLPSLQPFAEAGGKAIDGLLGKVNTFFQSADFKKWLSSFEKLVGPSITAIGDGIGQVIIAVGKLFTLMSSKDAVNAIKTAFAVITGVIQGVADLIQWIMNTWNGFMTAVRDVRNFINGNSGPGSSAPSGPPPRPVFHAAGGVVPGSGWSVVGENGPEMVRLPAGSTVYPSGSPSQAGGSQRIVLEITGGSREFQTFLKKTIRVYGGNPAVTSR